MKKILSFIDVFVLTFLTSKREKVTYIFETTDEHLDMVDFLSCEFNMTYDELINFLIYKQFLHFKCSSNKKLNEKNNA